MRTDKRARMMSAYNGHHGTVTVAAVAEQIPDGLEMLTGSQLGLVMSAINAAYHKGKSAAGAEICDDAVWVSGKLIPLRVINAIEKTSSIETQVKPAEGVCSNVSLTDETGKPLPEGVCYQARGANNRGAYYVERTHITTWSMPDVVERM